MVGKETPVDIRDLPVVVLIHIVIKADVFIRHDFRKRPAAIVTCFPAVTFRRATSCKLFFGEFMLDEPEA